MSDDERESALPTWVEAVVSDALGSHVDTVDLVPGGYSHARRRRVTLADGRSVFVKSAVDALTAGWLRSEAQSYAAIGDVAWCPRIHTAWNDPDDATRALVILEDLSGAHWPPPWRSGDIDAVLEALETIWTHPHLPHAQRLDQHAWRHEDGWHRVAAAPERFLALGLTSDAWLERNLPVLIDAQERAELTGDDLLHGDLRSDNLCRRRDGRVQLVDWNWPEIGNRRFELAAWQPSLAAETGRRPEVLVPDGGPYAALLAGFFLGRAALPPLPHAPKVRPIQRIQGVEALAWACRALALPSPDGSAPASA